MQEQVCAELPPTLSKVYVGRRSSQDGSCRKSYASTVLIRYCRRVLAPLIIRSAAAPALHHGAAALHHLARTAHHVASPHHSVLARRIRGIVRVVGVEGRRRDQCGTEGSN